MTRKVKSLDDMPLDVFQSVRRALVRRGFIRREREQLEQPAPTTKPKKLTHVSNQSHDILFKADTVFPFSLFPDTVTLDREKLTIATRTFFRVAKITSTPIRDILSAEVDVGPFFGSIHISSRFFVSGPYSVNFMWRRDAIELQRLLQGYVIAHEQEIECSHIDKNKLINLLHRLGKGDTS